MLYACDDVDNLTEEQIATGKDALTRFRFISYDKTTDTSVVKYIF